MRAAILREVGTPMRVEEIPRPAPKDHEVLVRVVSTGVCHTDLHVIKGEVGFPTPCVLGHEMAGVVTEVGPGVRNVSVGDRVVSPFIMPCGSCPFCARGESDLCSTFFAMNRLHGTLYDGTSRLAFPDGEAIAMYSMAGLAEYAVVPDTAVFRVPDGVDLVPAAVIGCAFLTGYGLLRHAGALRPGETVAVVGAGGVGSAVIQLARLFGASRVIAVDLADDKLDAAREVGATDVVNVSRVQASEAIRSVTEGEGADLVLEVVGRTESFATALAGVRDGGRLAMAGIAAWGAEAHFEITPLVRRKISILGSYGGRPGADMPVLLRMLAAGQIDPGRFVTRRFSLAEVAEAYATLDRGEIVGRAVIVAEGE